MQAYQKIHLQGSGREELHEAMGLTGAEISLNTLAAGTSVPFVHAHQKNEEIYGILSGAGTIVLNEETIPLQAGDWIRVAPEVWRQLSASTTQDLQYLCIQVREQSLEGYTLTDAILRE